MTEEELANFIALKQLGAYQQEENEADEFYRRRTPHIRFNSDNHASVVTDVSRRIARAAFRSEEWAPDVSRRLKETGTGILDFAKRMVENPGVKEGFIVASVMLFKMGLWFAYRNASKEGLEIVDL